MKNYLFKKNTETDVICLGRLGIDFNCNEINRPLEEVVTFTRTVGRSPANIAVGIAKLGLKVGFFGRVSDNGLGRFIINDLKSNDIDTTSIVMDKNAANCLAITEIKSPNDCGGILYRDNVADLNLTFDDIDEDKIKNAKALLVSGTALAIGLYTPPVGAVLFITCGIGKISIQDGAKAILPFMVAMVVIVLMVMYISEIIMTIPNMFK